MMHQDSLEPAAIRFTLERLQESARRSGYITALAIQARDFKFYPKSAKRFPSQHRLGTYIRSTLNLFINCHEILKFYD